MVSVVVVGGDAVVGTTLQLLLESADYRASFVAGPFPGEPGMLEGTDLLVLAPGLTGEQEEAAVFAAHGADDVAAVSVVKLVPELRKAMSTGNRRLVPWPCRAEELERQVKAALGHEPGARADEEG